MSLLPVACSALSARRMNRIDVEVDSPLITACSLVADIEVLSVNGK